MSSAQRRAFLMQHVSILQSVKILAPALAEGPNAEYPWTRMGTPDEEEDNIVDIVIPEEYGFLEIKEIDVIRMIKLARILLKTYR